MGSFFDVWDPAQGVLGFPGPQLSSLIFFRQWFFCKLKRGTWDDQKSWADDLLVCSQVIECGDLSRGCHWMVVGAKRKPENGEMWFSCKSRPQRCIFQHKDVFPDRRDVFSNYTPSHFTHQPGASWVYWLPKSRKMRLKMIIRKTSHGKGHWSPLNRC